MNVINDENLVADKWLIKVLAIYWCMIGSGILAHRERLKCFVLLDYARNEPLIKATDHSRHIEEEFRMKVQPALDCAQVHSLFILSISIYSRLTAICPGLPGRASTRKVKRIWIYWSKRVSGCSFSWAICKSAPHPRQITMPAPHHSVF